MISVKRRGRVVEATLCRPPVNAFNDDMIRAFSAVIDEATADPETAVLHIRSDQKLFSAGGDVAYLRSHVGTPAGPDTLVASLVRPMQELFQRIESAPFVSVAEIAGDALGGGLELAMACDLRVAAADVRLGLVEIRLGLLAAAGGTQRLTRLCGRAAAKRLILRGETVSARDAVGLGLVQWAVPAETLSAFAAELSAELAAAPRLALRAAKECIDAAAAGGTDGFALEAEWSRRLYSDAETIERLSAFLSRKKA